MNSRTLFCFFLSVVITLPLYSQSVLEEVVVTAQRREQNLQDVPVSVTAFTGAAIEQGNIRSATDYLSLTPNVSFTEDGMHGIGCLFDIEVARRVSWELCRRGRRWVGGLFELSGCDGYREWAKRCLGGATAGP